MALPSDNMFGASAQGGGALQGSPFVQGVKKGLKKSQNTLSKGDWENAAKLELFKHGTVSYTHLTLPTKA